METKYLSDGRKVVVIGQLNNVESIVQEIFVSDGGDQIPTDHKEHINANKAAAEPSKTSMKEDHW